MSKSTSGANGSGKPRQRLGDKSKRILILLAESGSQTNNDMHAKTGISVADVRATIRNLRDTDYIDSELIRVGRVARACLHSISTQGRERLSAELARAIQPITRTSCVWDLAAQVSA